MERLKLFSYLYAKTINWSAHRHAHYYLAGVSFAESSVFPIPPDVMLLTMGLAKPSKSWHYALITTLFSVMGGLFGYVIGYFAMSLIEPYLLASSYAHYYYQVLHWFEKGDIWMVFLAGLTPFPYKIFTITAGAMHMALMPFVLGSLIGRGLRFFLLSGILYFAGERIEKHLRHFIDIIGWSLLLILAIGYCLMKWVF